MPCETPASFVAVFCPVGFKLLRRAAAGTKKTVTSKGFPSGVDPPRSWPEPEPLLLKKNPTERKYSFLPIGRKARFRILAGYRPVCDSWDLNCETIAEHI